MPGFDICFIPEDLKEEYDRKLMELKKENFLGFKELEDERLSTYRSTEWITAKNKKEAIKEFNRMHPKAEMKEEYSFTIRNKPRGMF